LVKKIVELKQYEVKDTSFEILRKKNKLEKIKDNYKIKDQLRIQVYEMVSNGY
jgi:hypothetical protein